MRFVTASNEYQVALRGKNPPLELLSPFRRPLFPSFWPEVKQSRVSDIHSVN